MDAPIQIVYVDPGSPGYHVVHYMARLAAELMGGELVVVRSRSLTVIEKLDGLFSRKRRGAPCLLICPGPSALSSILQVRNWRSRCGRLVAWVFDSFWTDSIPRFACKAGVFDHVFVTEKEDLPTWARMMPAPVQWLPWGSDVLRLGSDNPQRPFDLARFGRQPPEWEDDGSTATECESRGLRFQGRPTTLDDATDNERSLMRILSESKYVLAFSNRVAATDYTHPEREYITGRWTEALGAGATVAGVPPRNESARSLLWDEATLDLGTASRSEGLEVIARAVREWTPTRARTNYLKSLERFDWRWRFKEIVRVLDVPAPRLDEELRRIRQIIEGRVATIASG